MDCDLEKGRCTAGGDADQTGRPVPGDQFWRVFVGGANGKSTVGGHLGFEYGPLPSIYVIVILIPMYGIPLCNFVCVPSVLSLIVVGGANGNIRGVSLGSE